MVPNCAPSRTVIAQYNSGSIPEFRRHRLGLDGNVQIPELAFHICETLVANRTFVRYFHVLFIASPMNTMTTSHEDYRSRRCKEVLAANRTIAFCRPFNALVRALNRGRDTCTASLVQVSDRYHEATAAFSPCSGKSPCRDLGLDGKYHSRYNGKRVYSDGFPTSGKYHNNSKRIILRS